MGKVYTSRKYILLSALLGGALTVWGAEPERQASVKLNDGGYAIVSEDVVENGLIDKGETVGIAWKIAVDEEGTPGELVPELRIGSPYFSVVEAPVVTSEEAGKVTCTFRIKADERTPDWHETKMELVLHDAEGGESAFSKPLYAGKVSVLIVDADRGEGTTSADDIAAYYRSHFGYSLAVSDTLPEQLDGYHSVWYCAGMRPDASLLEEEELDALKRFVGNGGNVYLEGGDVWYEQESELGGLFNVEVKSDDGGVLGTVRGNLPQINDREFLEYGYAYAAVDHIEAGAGATCMYRNAEPDFGVMVFNAGGQGKTIASSIELGGILDAGGSPMEWCLEYLGIDMPVPVSTVTEYFHEDFEDGGDAAFAIYDLDGQVPHLTMQQLGFETSEWMALTHKREGDNVFMASTSKFEDGVDMAANDWLVTPAIRMIANEARLTWRAKVLNNWMNKDGYKVYVSTTGNTPDDFGGQPVFEIEAESSSDWVTHEVALDGYEGQDIWIAFVNDSYNKYVLAIDDIVVEGGKGIAEIQSAVPAYIYGEGEIRVDADFHVFGPEGVKDMTAYCQIGDNVYTRTFEGINMAENAHYSFSFDEKQDVHVGDTLRYTLWAEADGVRLNTVNGSAVVYAFQPVKRVLIEEMTGLWCGYCPEGIVAMDWLQAKYPDEVVPVVVHTNDLMGMDDYATGLGAKSFPSAFVDRAVYNQDPLIEDEDANGKFYNSLKGGLESSFLEVRAIQPDVDVNVSATIDRESRTVNGRFEVVPAIDLNDKEYRLVVVLTEDSVWGEEYVQSNYYSGSEIPLGGFEKMESNVVLECRHVARLVCEDVSGIANSIPASLPHSEPFVIERTIEIPESVQDLGFLNVVAAVYDVENNRIVNCNEWKSDLPSSIGDVVVKGGIGFHVEENQGILTIPADWQGSRVEVSLYNTQGVRIGCWNRSVAGGSCVIPLDVIDGVYFLGVRSEAGTEVIKFLKK